MVTSLTEHLNNKGIAVVAPDTKIVSKIVNSSVGESLDSILTEWKVSSIVSRHDKSLLCACGKTHLSLAYKIQNKNTSAIIQVGSGCLKLFSNIKRLDKFLCNKDPYSAKLDTIWEGLAAAFEYEIINAWEHDFLKGLRIRYKSDKELSIKQRACKNKIISKIKKRI